MKAFVDGSASQSTVFGEHEYDPTETVEVKTSFKVEAGESSEDFDWSIKIYTGSNYTLQSTTTISDSVGAGQEKTIPVNHAATPSGPYRVVVSVVGSTSKSKTFTFVPR